jgi:hypothetical protein
VAVPGDLGADVILYDRIRALQAASPSPPPVLDGPRHVLEREGLDNRAEWEARWSEAEDLYFERLMPPSAFVLVLDGSRI